MRTGLAAVVLLLSGCASVVAEFQLGESRRRGRALSEPRGEEGAAEGLLERGAHLSSQPARGRRAGSVSARRGGGG